ncbi:MAG: amidophosphoribosyltransferase [Candidatus Brocadiia bacterium]|jgi:amidophosphoribosyltransferase
MSDQHDPTGRPREACGLFGIYGHEDAVYNTFLGLYSLQHRGEESCGIASTNGTEIVSHRAMGLVSDALTPEVLAGLKNRVAIGHVRYSTTGGSRLENAQPFVAAYSGGPIALAHNGNLVNTSELRRDYERHGGVFQTTTDTEVIVHVIAKSGVSAGEHLGECLNALKGSYSLLILTPREMIAARDPHGYRPLSLGELKGAYAVASETCALRQIGARYVRDIEPGEMIRITDGDLESHRFAPRSEIRPQHCIFELIYFARPDSMVFGQNVHEVRKKLGAQLAREHPVEADVVVPIPDGGNSAAIGYSRESGIPLDYGFIRNHYIGRTFIQASQAQRSIGVAIKLSPVEEVVRGKRVIVVDDSIVRGTTSRAKLAQLRDAGARELHMRVTCPPHCHPCYYGIDFQAKRELIAARSPLEEIRRFLKLDSLGYLSVDGMLSCVKPPKENYCAACFTGEYAVPPCAEDGKFSLEVGAEKT